MLDPLRILAVVLLTGLWLYPALAQEAIHPGLSGQPLLEAIDADFSPTNWYSYDDARDTLFLRIDADGDQLRGVYTGYSITLTPGEDPSTDAFNKGINTEHTWPQSMGADEIPARSDMHHLFPVKDNVNSSRSNCPYDEIPDAETDTWYWTDQSSSAIPSTNIDAWSEKDNDNPSPSYDCRFEPREDHKGDAARAVFYFAAVYPERTNADFFEVQKEVLRDWHYADFPTEAERDRSDRIAAHQGIRNPFVVDTTLVRRAFFSGSSSAEIQTASYTFEGNDECPTMDNGVEGSPVGAQFSDFVRVGVECNNAAGVFNSRSWPSARHDDSYVTFSVTPESGNIVRFSESTQLSFMTRRSGTGPPSGEVMFRTGSSSQFTSLGTWELPDTDDHVIEVTIPDTSVSDVMEIRFLGWGSTSSVGTLRFDDIEVEYIHETSVAIERSREELPASFELISAYPNPFNPSTTVTLSVNKADDIAIELFDVIGRRVKDFGTAYFPPGEHDVRVDAAGLPSGAYWIRATGTRHSAGRMVLLQK